MDVAPEHYRVARLALPRLSLAAILGFSFVAMGGSVFLAYTSFNHGEVEILRRGRRRRACLFGACSAFRFAARRIRRSARL